MPHRRRRPTSPPATPLDDEDLLADFVLRLPPRPSSRPRAAAACKAWRRIVTDPHFLRRFRAYHRKAPLLGFFNGDGNFFPTLEAPDRVLAARLFVSWKVVACRNGLVLCSKGKKLQVLNPMAGDRSAILTKEDKLPVDLNVELVVDSTNVERLCFRLFALSTDAYRTKLSAFVYLSDSGAWTHSVEILVSRSTIRSIWYPSTFVGNAFYWPHVDGGIVRYDLETQTLAIVEAPLNNEEGYDYDDTVLIMTKDGLVSIAILDEDELTIQFWVRETIRCGATKWVLRATVRPDTPPLEQDVDTEYCWPVEIVGFEEENNVVFLSTHRKCLVAWLRT